jgi:hypothetical protein
MGIAVYTCSLILVMSSLSRCSNTSHPPTDQFWLVGCRMCLVEQYASSSSFFSTKHLPGGSQSPYASCFTYHPSSHSLSFPDSGAIVVVDSQRAFIECWLAESRASLMWNSKHSSANFLVKHVPYGSTGSGTTLVGALHSNLTGLQVGRALDSGAHAYPVNPGFVSSDLTEWPWRCRCGALAPKGASLCLACSSSTRT